MNKLDLCPIQESYSVKYGASIERIELRGGFGRYVQTKNAKKHLVDVEFTLREDDFIYFRAFFLNWQLNPLSFLMSLIIEDSEYGEYIAQFVPDSFAFNELSGLVFKVSAQLVVVTTNVQVLTSQLYPVESVEYLSISLDAKNAIKNDVPFNVENLAMDFSIGTVLSRDATSTLSSPVESVTSQFAATGALIRDNLGSLKAPIDPVTSTLTVNQAKLSNLLISNTMEVQNMTSAFAINSAKYTN